MKDVAMTTRPKPFRVEPTPQHHPKTPERNKI
jgi:hypothetical protein